MKKGLRADYEREQWRRRQIEEANGAQANSAPPTPQ